MKLSSLNNILYGHRDPTATIAKARRDVASEFARVEHMTRTMTCEERDQALGITEFNGRGLGRTLRIKRRRVSL